MKKIKIYTHNGIFHSDEVVAVALLKAFINENIEVHRVPHQSKEEVFKNADFIVDIGRKFDGERYFDHHQNKPTADGKSSAGLIFDYLIKKGAIAPSVAEELRDVIRVIDLQDLGIQDAPAGHLANLIKYYNANNVYSEEQDQAFLFAVDVAARYFSGVKRKHEKIKAAELALKKCQLVDGGRVLKSDSYIPFWNVAIFNLPEYEGVDAFLWWDENQKIWKVQQVPDAPGGLGRRGRRVKFIDPLPQDVVFIHRGEFFAVGKTPEALIALLG